MSIKIRAVVDRFEGDKAVLFVGDEEVQAIWPRKFMPNSTVEGSILMVNMAVDTEATAQARGKAEDLLRQILAQNVSR